MRGGVFAAAAAITACTLPSSAGAEDFFLVRDENPLVRSFYVPLPSDNRSSDGADFSASLVLGNTLNVENRGGESLHIDGESTTLQLSYENALSSSVRYRFSVPLIHDSGGFLDSTIDAWHRIFGLPRGNRPYYPKYQIDYTYSGRGNVDIQSSQTSFGDLAADLGWYGVDDDQRTLSIWGGIEAPTGSVSKLTSDGAWDAAAWVHGALRFARWDIAAELGVAQPLGDEIFAGYAHKTSAFTRLAATRALGPQWSLRAQVDGQTARVNDSKLRLLGPSLQLTLGVSRRLGNRWHLDMGFAEDAAVNTAPDVTFFFGIRN